jgi:hypothetical protein
MYTPKPVDTSDVVLPEELNRLAETIAENVHEVWARNRIEQGWTHGAVRCDEQKTHPCLIPYSSLSEEEKRFDRETAFETIKFIRKLGFNIVKE